jgi:murein DD-endopeptidase MepM/ murein hydrolase activator NlpD
MSLPRWCRRAILGAASGLLCLLSPALHPAAAQGTAPPGGGFGLPVDCVMGEVCSVQNYIDHDPGPGWADHTCGPLSYDGHRGIDIRVPTQIEMRRGVAVVAAADGEVLIARDGQPDILMQDSGPGKSRDQRNGNWVAIRHGGGWVTTYAHMMLDSVAVKAGQRVIRGQKLGLIGLSGNSDFPHLHFAVTRNNELLDPFTGQGPKAACGEAAETLWSPAAAAQLAYRAGGLLAAGFLDRQPNHREVLEGIAPLESLRAEAPVFIFWTGSWGLRQGDRHQMTILSPDGKIFATAEGEIERNRAVASRWIGKKRRQAPWPSGRYRAIYRVERPLGGSMVTVIDISREIDVR